MKCKPQQTPRFRLCHRMNDCQENCAKFSTDCMGFFRWRSQMLRTLTCVTLGMTVMNSFTNEISHLLKKKGWEINVHLHKSNPPPLLSSNKMLMLFISHTLMCTQMLYFEPEESNKSSASLLDTEYMRGSCNENFKTERGP